MGSLASPTFSISEASSSAARPSVGRVKPDSVVVREKLQGRWHEYSASQWHNLVEEIAVGLSELGVGAGAYVAVICDNHSESVLIETAARSVGAIVTLLNCRAISNDISLRAKGFSVVVVDNEQMLAHIKSIRSTIDGSGVRYIIVNPKTLKSSAVQNADVISLAHIQERGRHGVLLREQRLQPPRDSNATELIFTVEGRGHQPRFVDFSCAAIEAAQERTVAALQLLPGDEIVSSIPVHTVLGHTIKAAALQARARFNFPELRGSLLTDLINVEPSIVIGSGRLWKEIFLRVQLRVEAAPRPHRAAFQYLMSGSLSWIKKYLIAKPLLRQLGLRRVRHAFSTGFVSHHVRDLFWRLGVQIVELYEIPEAGGVVARVTRESAAHPVLHPVVGIDIKLHSDSRIKVDYRARNNGPRDRKNGFGCSEASSNDIGRRRDEHIEFCGSRDRVITLSDGTEVMPESIEAVILKASTLIRAVVLVGEGRPELAALIVLERDPLIAWARKHGVYYTTVAELCGNSQLNQHVRTLLEGATPLQDRPIKRFAILPRDPDYDLAEVTDMDRIWTSKLIENSHTLIERMYSE
jgi:long-chain acyl-CoA synthetase